MGVFGNTCCHSLHFQTHTYLGWRGLAWAGAANLLSLGVAVGAVILALSIFGALRFGKGHANAAPETNAS